MTGTETPASGSRGRSQGRRVVLSLRLLVPAAAAIMLGAVIAAAGFVWQNSTRRLLVREIETRLMVETRHLALAASGALLESFPELTLQPIVRDLVAERKELEAVVVLDHRGRIVGSPMTESLGQTYRLPSGLPVPAETTHLRSGESLVQDRSRIIAIAPVLHASHKRLGTAIVILPRRVMEAAIADTRRQLNMLLLGALPLGTLATFILISLLLRPLSALRSGLERIGRGDLDSRIHIRDLTEIGGHADTINSMAEQIKAGQNEELERLRLRS